MRVLASIHGPTHEETKLQGEDADEKILCRRTVTIVRKVVQLEKTKIVII